MSATPVIRGPEEKAKFNKDFDGYFSSKIINAARNEKYKWRSIALIMISLVATVAVTLAFHYSNSTQLSDQIEKVIIGGVSSTALCTIAAIIFNYKKNNFPEFAEWRKAKH